MSSVFYIFKDFNVFFLLCFQRLQCLLFSDSKTTMSFALHFQRLQCLQSFTFSKTSISFFYAFKDYNVFFLCFQDFNVLHFAFYRTSRSSVWFYRTLMSFCFFRFYFFCFLWRPILNSKIARIKLGPLSLLTIYYQ